MCAVLQAASSAGFGATCWFGLGPGQYWVKLLLLFHNKDGQAGADLQQKKERKVPDSQDMDDYWFCITQKYAGVYTKVDSSRHK